MTLIYKMTTSSFLLALSLLLMVGCKENTQTTREGVPFRNDKNVTVLANPTANVPQGTWEIQLVCYQTYPTKRHPPIWTVKLREWQREYNSKEITGFLATSENGVLVKLNDATGSQFYVVRTSDSEQNRKVSKHHKQDEAVRRVLKKHGLKQVDINFVSRGTGSTGNETKQK